MADMRGSGSPRGGRQASLFVTLLFTCVPLRRTVSQEGGLSVHVCTRHPRAWLRAPVWDKSMELVTQ